MGVIPADKLQDNCMNLVKSPDMYYNMKRTRSGIRTYMSKNRKVKSQ